MKKSLHLLCTILSSFIARIAFIQVSPAKSKLQFIPVAVKTVARINFVLLCIITATTANAQNCRTTLSAVVTNTCAGGVMGSVTLTPGSGKAPYSFDHLSYAFSGNGYNANLFEARNGAFAVSGDLQAGDVTAIGKNTCSNAFLTAQSYTDNGYLRAEGSFKFQADATAFFGLANPSGYPVKSGDLPICFAFNQGSLQYMINNAAVNIGSYDIGTWYDFRIEKKGTVIKFSAKKSSDDKWNLLATANYVGLVTSFKVATQYYDDNLTTRGFSSNNWKLSFNPPTTDLNQGDYKYTVIDAAGCSATAQVEIKENVAFVPAVSVTNPSTLGNDGSVAINSTVSPILYISAPRFFETFNSSYDASQYTISNGAFRPNGSLKADRLGDDNGWNNSFTTKNAYNDNGVVVFEASCRFDADAMVFLGLTSATKPIQNFGDHLISFYYLKGKLNYYINGGYTEIGAYAGNTTFDFKIEKVGALVKFYTKKGNENWKLAGMATYTGNDQVFKAGAQYYGRYSENGGFTCDDMAVSQKAALSNLTAADYNYQVVSTEGCSANVVFTLLNNVTFDAASVNALCYGYNGSITINALTGLAPFKYSVDNGAHYSQSNTFSVEAGTYQVIVKGADGGLSMVKSITVAEPNAVVANITAGGPTSFCEGKSVTFISSPGASYLWSNGATTSSIVLNRRGDYSVKVTDATGCFSTSSKVGITVWDLPTVKITAVSDNILCAGITLTAASNSNNDKYLWSNGPTSKVINLTTAAPDGVYTVTATSSNGCSASIGYNVDKTGILGSYAIVGLSSVNLATGTTVATGSVGVTASNGTLTLGKNASVASQGAFVKANDLNINNDAIASRRISLPVSVTLPDLQNNTSKTSGLKDYNNAQGTMTLTGNYHNVTIKSGANVTLTGNTFAAVTIESGAQVYFSSTTVNLEKLVIQKSSTNSPKTIVRFKDNTVVKVSSSVTVSDRCVINGDELDVTFYMGDINNDAEKFVVDGSDVKFSGTIYMPVGTLAVKGDNDDVINMTGLFIAQKVTSTGPKVTWKGFGCNGAPATSSRQVATAPEMLAVENLTGMQVSVGSNPTANEFTLMVKSNSSEKAIIRIMDANGRAVENMTVNPNTSVRVGRGFVSGSYYAQIVQGAQHITTKLIKL